MNSITTQMSRLNIRNIFNYYFISIMRKIWDYLCLPFAKRDTHSRPEIRKGIPGLPSEHQICQKVSKRKRKRNANQKKVNSKNLEDNPENTEENVESNNGSIKKFYIPVIEADDGPGSSSCPVQFEVKNLNKGTAAQGIPFKCQSRESRRKRRKRNQKQQKIEFEPQPPRPQQFPNYLTGVCGLQNIGNTCYMNSAIQCLSNIELLTKFCEEFHQGRPPYSKNDYLIANYCELNEKLWSGQSGSVSPKAFKAGVSQLFPRFSGFGQNDCSELLTSVLSRFHEELMQLESSRRNDFIDYDSYEDYLQNNNSFIAQNFHGFQRFRLSCVCGQTLVQRYDPFVVLNLPQINSTRPTKVVAILIRNNTNDNPFRVELRFQTNQVLVSELIESLRKDIQNRKLQDLYSDCLVVTEITRGQIRRVFRLDNCLNLDELTGKLCVFEKDCEFTEQIFVVLKSCSGSFGIPLLLNISDKDMKTEFCLKFCAIFNSDLNEKESQLIKNIQLFPLNSDQNISNYEILITDTIPHSIYSKYSKLLNNYYGFDSSVYFQKPGYDSHLRLEQSLDNYISMRKMNSNDKLFCTECQTNVSPNEQISVVFPPNVLILQLKTNPNLQSYSSETRYEFPLVLNFKKFVLNSKPNNDSIYDLIAISNYSGNSYSGHYTAYAKNFKNNKWYNFNDNYVEEISEPDLISSRAYLLFYIKR